MSKPTRGRPSIWRWPPRGEAVDVRWAGLLVLWLLSWMLASERSAVSAFHPFHVCIGQMQWNPSESHWEVSLRLHPQDLERAMSAEAGKPISMEDEDFSDAALAYLSEQFFICRRAEGSDLKGLVAVLEAGSLRGAGSDAVPKAAGGGVGLEHGSQVGSMADDERSTLKWVGMENERGWLWVHLEMVPPKDELGTQMWLVHRVLLDSVERQENSVSILQSRTNRYALQFKRGTPGQPMRAMP